MAFGLLVPQLVAEVTRKWKHLGYRAMGPRSIDAGRSARAEELAVIGGEP